MQTRTGNGDDRYSTGRWLTAFAAFKFAKFLYLAPFLFGYVPGFSLDGSASDIAISFALIMIGTYAYSWVLSGIWIPKRKQPRAEPQGEAALDETGGPRHDKP